MRPYLLLIVLVVFLASCDHNDYRLKSRPEYLTEGSWYLEQANVTAGIAGQEVHERLTRFISLCMKDNALRFLPDGRILMHEGLETCEGSQAVTETGNWQLLDNATRLQASLPGLPIPLLMQVTDLDGKYLKLYGEGAYMGADARFEVIYSHKQ